ncbi:MAG: hypothetical protein ACR5KV_02940 [Wolbachia sp.]
MVQYLLQREELKFFSNNKPGTLYDPSSQDKDDTEKMAKLNKKILDGIDNILKTPIKEIPEQIFQGSKNNILRSKLLR